MAAALALAIKRARLLFMEPRDQLKEEDIYPVTRLVAWHGSNLCQAPEERRPSPVLSVWTSSFVSNLLLHACTVL